MTRILVVEDSPTQAEELRIILESEGFDVDRAADGQAGLEELAESEFDLVISDILMPRLSGFDFCRAVKNDRRTIGTPVILLTSLSDPMDIIQGLECGADNFLTKPYEPDQLIARLRSILEHRKLRQDGTLKVGVEILFLGRKFLITSDKQQILDLLISTFEDTVRTNRQLRASQAAAEAANKELEAFSYSVSHDLRAPLRIIDGFSEMLREECGDELNDRGRDYLKNVRAAAKRMAELIDDLLELSRVSRAELHRSPTNLSEIAASVSDQLKKAQPERQGEFITQGVPFAQADRRLMRVVLENLLGNAWKFTSKAATPRIEFGADERAGELVYMVQDNGVGFDMRYADKLFAPFQRLHREADFPGTGIGLATVRRIIERHGGRVWAESAVGRGATVFFTVGAPSGE